MKILKVEVSGYFQEVFEGNEKIVFSYLENLKERQAALLSAEMAQWYKTWTRPGNLLTSTNAHKFEHIYKTFVNPFVWKSKKEQTVFREHATQFALKIQISTTSQF